MTLSLATINVNGLRDKKKRDLVFNLLVAKKLDIICIKEIHSTKDDLIRWQNEWKNCGGGNSSFNCGTSNSRNVGILLSKKLKENVEFSSQDNYIYNSGRILRSTLKINDSTFYISNIYAPNNGRERKYFLMQLTIHCSNIRTIQIKSSFILGDFSCAIKKN